MKGEHMFPLLVITGKERCHMKTYTPREVANIMNVTYATMLNLIYKNKVKAFKVGAQWRITEEELDKLMEKEDNSE